MANSVPNHENEVTFLTERKVNEDLWKQVVNQSNGSEVDKLNAVETLFKNHYSLPKESMELLKRLSEDDLQNVRLKIAHSLVQKENENIPYILYVELIEILKNDSVAEIKDIGEKLYQEKIEPLNNLWKVCSEANRQIFRNFQALNLPLINFQRQWLDLTSSLNRITIPKLDFPSAALMQLAENQKRFNSLLSKQLLQVTPNYFPSRELSIVNERLPVAKQSKASILEQKLAACLPSDGRDKSKKRILFDDKWKIYQDTCKKILSYTIVPPLLGPLEESRTKSTGGSQRRDLIFNIPHDVLGFWQWVSVTHDSLSIIFECKNYGKPLKQNQVVITSKYLGRKRLGNLAIILTRNGLSKGAITEQKRLWVEEDKCILCLNDQDLIKMLQLKENKNDPTKVIDGAIRSFRESLA